MTETRDEGLHFNLTKFGKFELEAYQSGLIENLKHARDQ